ncbi:MAG: sortase [Clostridiales bacterium]|nr:sortase [Clostridiales bacterium]
MTHPKNKRRKGILWMTGGLLLIAAALLLTGYNLWDEKRAEMDSRAVLHEMIQQGIPGDGNGISDSEEEIIPDYVLNPDMEMPAVVVNGHEYVGIITIHALGIELPVMNSWSYAQLKIAPCRYAGSVYRGDLIVAAHNYTCHFGRLKALRTGDTVDFTDMDGNRFHYRVVKTEHLKETAVEEMEAGEWDLTLFTCTRGGANRVTVRCKRLDDSSGFSR